MGDCGVVSDLWRISGSYLELCLTVKN